MESKMQDAIIDSSDEAILLAILAGVEITIDLGDVILNYFFFQKTIIWYQSLNSSLRHLVAANFLIQKDGVLIINKALKKEIIVIRKGKHTKYTKSEQLYQLNPINSAKLAELPEHIISEQEFELGITMFYNFLNKNFPHKLSPRKIAEDMLLIQETSTDPTYGLTPENPIKVGGFAMVGTLYIHLYFNSLLGKNGNPITYKRVAACKQIETPIGRNGRGFIDLYSVQMEGEESPIKIYVNMYNCVLPLKAPMGFAAKVMGG